MSLRTQRGRAATPLAVVGLISGCGAAVAATPTPVAPDRPAGPQHAPPRHAQPAARTRAACPDDGHDPPIARRQYSTEIHGVSDNGQVLSQRISIAYSTCIFERMKKAVVMDLVFTL